MDTLKNAWNKIPLPVRTIINVAIAASVVSVASVIISNNGVTSVDWLVTTLSAVNIFFVSIATAAVRALNPLDDAYGIGSERK